VIPQYRVTVVKQLCIVVWSSVTTTELFQMASHTMIRSKEAWCVWVACINKENFPF
jgi:hypothetical protein